MPKLLMVEKNIATNWVIVTCPNCGITEYYQAESLSKSYNICDSCYYVFPSKAALTNPILIESTIDMLELDSAKVANYINLRADELLSFHCHENDTIE